MLRCETTACLLCNGQRHEPLIELPAMEGEPPSGAWTIVRCGACGLVFLNPRPSETDIGAFYAEDYAPHQIAARTAQIANAMRRKSWPGWWNQVLATLFPPDVRRGPRWQGEGRLLDVGCGGGEFLWRMHARGWQVAGLDTSPAAVARIRDELRLPAWQGSLPHPELRAESFDVVTFWQSLEHVHQPLETLRRARELLVPSGRLVVSVPNIEGVGFRWFGANWLGLDPPRHLTHFAPSTLQQMLEAAGFRVRRMGHLRRAGWLEESARTALAQGDRRPVARLLSRRAAARWAAWFSCRTGQSDCLVAEAVRIDGDEKFAPVR